MHAGREGLRAAVPVLCVGNVTAGGSGKTPVALALYDAVLKAGVAQKPYFLTRGYGGSEKGPLHLDASIHTPRDTGDEPFLLACKGPVIVSQDRPMGAQMAASEGADMILMDDGFQNPSLLKDISFLVIDGETGLGNERLLPAGPLREPFSDALARCDAVIMIGADKRGILERLPPDMPVFECSLESCFAGDETDRYVAFAGLGRPEKFRRSVLQAGLSLAGFHSFPDHHPYSDHDLEKLAAEAGRHDAKLLTTEKDAVRLPSSFRAQVEVFPIALRWGDEERILAFLRQKLHSFELRS